MPRISHPDRQWQPLARWPPACPRPSSPGAHVTAAHGATRSRELHRGVLQRATTGLAPRCHASAASVVCRRKVPREQRQPAAAARSGRAWTGWSRAERGAGFASSPGLACETVSTPRPSPPQAAVEVEATLRRDHAKMMVTPTIRIRKNLVGDLHVEFHSQYYAPPSPCRKLCRMGAPAARCPYLAALRPPERPQSPPPRGGPLETDFVATNSRPGPAWASSTPPRIPCCFAVCRQRAGVGQGVEAGGSQRRARVAHEAMASYV